MDFPQPTEAEVTPFIEEQDSQPYSTGCARTSKIEKRDASHSENDASTAYALRMMLDQIPPAENGQIITEFLTEN
jgi:hypothetical protein